MDSRLALLVDPIACQLRRPLSVLGLAFGLVFPLFANHAARGDEPVRFNVDIRPILSKNCFACHGFDAKHREADLRLDIAEGALADRVGARAIVPGDPASSEVWRRIISDDPDERMPPADSHKTLSEADQALIKRWIEQGAPYQRHWSFEPPVAVAPPELGLTNGTELSHPVDRFIADRLRRSGMRLSPEADRPTLIRRVAFALTGLPPTPGEVDQFLQDQAAGAYERMVDRYLESPHYGEEMARHWLDVARYADTHGMHLDNERQTWAYRDWVVRAFNQNLPFDQFTIDQLAGDLLPEPTQDQVVATGFNRCNVTSSEGGSIDAELIFRYAVDRTSTMTQAWMGLTGGCAVCHDHKFDPISQREFYSLYSFFYSAADPAMDGNALLTEPVLKLTTEAAQAQLAELDAKMVAQQQQIDAATAGIEYQDPALSERSVETPVEVIWLEDEFPLGGQVVVGPGHATQFVDSSAGVPVHSGQRALRRSDTGLSQDVWEQATQPLSLPQQAEIFAHVWLDPQNPPRAVMLQFYKAGWLHRAVWGDYDAIPWGAAGTTERVSLGDLPTTGSWMRLSVPIERVGLAAGDQLTGFALTQWGGTVMWDRVGVSGTSDPARDPRRSFLAWWRQAQGRDTAGLPADLNAIAKLGPEGGASGADVDRLRLHYFQQVCVETQPRFATLLAELNQLRAERTAVEAAVPSTFIFRDLPQPRQSFVMMRGAYDKPGDPVEPGVPAVLPPLANAAGARPTRLDLARWLVSSEHPLTARVTVNRLWQQLLGTGLVKTSYDFGSQGESPSHPELLDWLAVQFRESGWNVKQWVRLVVTSATFRQTSYVTTELYAQDPENRWYARGPRFRLDAEQIRDNALFVSGLIQLQMGGKGVRTYQPPNIWEPVGFAGSNTRFYQQDQGQALYRRSLYAFLKRTAPPPFMSNFDAPNREQFCTRRERSNTPLQALQLMNDVQHVEAARALAERVVKEGGATPEERITYAYRRVLARTPEPAEMDVVRQQLADHLARYQADPSAASQLISQGETSPDASLNASEVAAYSLVANMLLNLDETLTRN